MKYLYIFGVTYITSNIVSVSCFLLENLIFRYKQPFKISFIEQFQINTKILGWFYFYSIAAQRATESSTLRIMLRFKSTLLKSTQTPELWLATQKLMLSAALFAWWASQTIALHVWPNAIICLQSKFYAEF